MIPENEVKDGDRIQKEKICNKYLPFYHSIQRQSPQIFNEIQMQLSRLLQLCEIEAGFSHWSSELTSFISLYGYSFTKAEHIKLIQFYLSILSIKTLNCTHVKTCFDMLVLLLRETKLLTRTELTIDWRLLYDWGHLIRFHHDQNYSLGSLPNDIEQSLINCALSCRFYFSGSSTQEILDEFRPWLCPFDTSFGDAMYFFHLFLPMNLPVELHHQGFKLWLSEFVGIWESVSSNSNWESYFIHIFSSVAWNNIGYIDWEPWLPQIFTRVLRSLSLPVGNLSSNTRAITYSASMISSLIVATIGNGSSCLTHIHDLFTAMKIFYHPSNTGDFQQGLVHFLNRLAEKFVERVCQERNVEQTWYFREAPMARLTDEDITTFVHCLQECLHISIFNKLYLTEAAAAFRSVAMLRPELLISPLIDQLFVSVDNMIEPYRFTSILTCLTGVALEIVCPTSKFSRNQTYVLPLLMSVLPGIDSNDFEKTNVTLQFLSAILKMIICVDCSSAIHSREDLSQIEKEVCLSTAKFEDFIIELLNRTFQMMDHLSTEESHTTISTDDNETLSRLISVLKAIVQQCSDKLSQVIRGKITNFLAVSSFNSKVNSVVPLLVRPILQSNPIETLQSLLPQTCERIEKIIDDSPSTLITDYEGDPELTWCLVLFSELVRARGDTLVIYKARIFSVFHRTVQLIHKESYGAVANATKNLLRSLSNVYPIEYRLTRRNINEPFTHFLPIRGWGEHVEFDEVQAQFHIPNGEEVKFACDFVETFLYPQLTLLNEKCSNTSKNERLRSLTLICSIGIGCLQMVPRIDSEPLTDLSSSSSISFDSKHKVQHVIYAVEPKFRENLRRRLIIDIGDFLDHLVDKHADDTASISLALQIYAFPSCYYGMLADECNQSVDIETLTYSLQSEMKNKRCFPRSLIIKSLQDQIDLFALLYYVPFTEMDKQVVSKLVELSMDRYSDIRINAQQTLFVLLYRFRFAYKVIVTRLLGLLNASDQVNHDQFKGCLYILLGNGTFFLPSKRSWSLLEQLWPSIAKTMHATKPSTQTLLNQIVSKILQDFEVFALIEETNAGAIQAAVALCRALDSEELEIAERNRERSDEGNIQSYRHLLESLTFSSNDNRLTWYQQEKMVNLLSQLFQRRVPLPSSCITTGVHLLIHDNIELRQMAYGYLSALCRLQKPPRIYVQKTREDLLQQFVGNECQPGDRKDNLWVTINDYQPATTQAEWEQTCFLDKSFHGYYQWPRVIRYPVNQRERYRQGNMSEQVTILFDRFTDKKFIGQFVQLLVLDLGEGGGFDVIRFRMFTGLFRNFGMAFVEHFMEILKTLIEEKTTEKQQASAQVAAEIVAGLIRGSKYWTMEMHEQLWTKLTPFLSEACANLSLEVANSWYHAFWHILGDVDPRRMFRVIDFLLSLMNIPSTANTISETSRWYLVGRLSNLEWRIPQLWHVINTNAQPLLFHSHKTVRERIISILNTSFAHDVTLPNGRSTRHPNVDVFLTDIRQRLQEAIDIYEKTPAVDNCDDVGTNHSKAQQALEFIETVIELCIKILNGCQQPIRRGMIELFPQLCSLENIVSHDENLQARLVLSRAHLATLYKHVPFLEALIDQVECVGKSDKWHARRAALEFVQYLVFVNLFHARSFASRIRRLVLKHLSDEQLEVRTVASLTLAGFYQCAFIPITNEDLEDFRSMSKTNYWSKVEGKKIPSIEKLIQRHSGVLGLCAVVLAGPYDIPMHVPDALMCLCEHLHDPSPIRESVKYALSEFRRTHHDSWHEHREKFTDEQLVILTELLISPTYYV